MIHHAIPMEELDAHAKNHANTAQNPNLDAANAK
jgi:hypothetical protein